MPGRAVGAQEFMPIKLTEIHGNLTQRLAALRLTVKNNEGLNMMEVAGAVHCSEYQARMICGKRQWAIKNFVEATGRYETLLVNPHEAKKYYAAKTRPEAKAPRRQD